MDSAPLLSVHVVSSITPTKRLVKFAASARAGCLLCRARVFARRHADAQTHRRSAKPAGLLLSSLHSCRSAPIQKLQAPISTCSDFTGRTGVACRLGSATGARRAPAEPTEPAQTHNCEPSALTCMTHTEHRPLHVQKIHTFVFW